MAGGIDFNRGKLKELVLFFAQESERASDEGFGMVKLNKLLYRADFEAYRRRGRSMTGETYEKQEFGPVARDLLRVLDELAAAGRLRWQTIPRGDNTRKVPGLTDDFEAQPDLSLFDAEERQIIAETLEELSPHGGRSASEWSHEQSAGWNVAAEYGDAIEYATTFVSTAPVPAEDLERATEFVRENGWIRNSA